MKRKLFIAVSVVAVLFGGASMYLKSHDKKVDAVQAPTTQLPPPPTPTTVKPSEKTHSKKRARSSGKQGGSTVQSQQQVGADAQTVVDAGATTIKSLAQLMFAQDKTYINSIVSTSIAPSNPNVSTAAQAAVAQAMTEQFGWDNVYEAQVKAYYYVLPRKYRIKHMDNHHATIAFFEVAHFDSGPHPIGCLRKDGTRYQCILPNRVYWLPQMNYYKLELIKGQWLCVNYKPAPANKQPKLLPQLQYNQAVQRFNPYLKGFVEYKGA
jgi:hypothetical protein